MIKSKKQTNLTNVGKLFEIWLHIWCPKTHRYLGATSSHCYLLPP